MASEMELLQEIITELKGMKTEMQGLRSDVNGLKTEQIEANERLVALETNDKSIMSILGQIQGDIEEIQGDTQYLAMRKLINKNPELLKKFTGGKPPKDYK